MITANATEDLPVPGEKYSFGQLELAQAMGGPTDLLIADASTRVGEGYEGGYGHMDPAQCGRLARDVQADTLWMTHYTGLDSAKLMRKAAHKASDGSIPYVVVAIDGQMWQSTLKNSSL